MRLKYDQKAIETEYRGYLFRSRLEARWAAFFDLCEWGWGYEPPEMGGWLPDFVLGETATLVEVKPFFHAEEWGGAIEKILNSSHQGPTILLGADPTWRLSPGTIPQLGWVLEQFYVGSDDGCEFCTKTCPLHFGFTEGSAKLGLCPMNDAWWNPIWESPSENDSKWCRVWDHGLANKRLSENWAEATNIVRWMPVA